MLVPNSSLRGSQRKRYKPNYLRLDKQKMMPSSIPYYGIKESWGDCERRDSVPLGAGGEQNISRLRIPVRVKNLA